MPTIKVFATEKTLTDAGFAASIPEALAETARIMNTDIGKVHIMGVPVIVDPDADVAHIQVEYLPTQERTNAFIADAGRRLASSFAERLSRPVRVRLWPTHGVEMADAFPAEAI